MCSYPSRSWRRKRSIVSFGIQYVLPLTNWNRCRGCSSFSNRTQVTRCLNNFGRHDFMSQIDLRAVVPSLLVNAHGWRCAVFLSSRRYGRTQRSSYICFHEIPSTIYPSIIRSIEQTFPVRISKPNVAHLCTWLRVQRSVDLSSTVMVACSSRHK